MQWQSACNQYPLSTPTCPLRSAAPLSPRSLTYLMREAISMQSACNQHAISMQSACNQHAIIPLKRSLTYPLMGSVIRAPCGAPPDEAGAAPSAAAIAAAAASDG